MQGVELVSSAWKQWGLQALVMLSFTLQITLLVLAEFRRRLDSGVLRFFVWSAYMLADAVAIYVLGHMSVTSTSPEHELMALWAPFLLLHLGGQDNIIAYAIEDNQLWLRHLQTLAVQVAAATYILYESSVIISSRPSSLLRPATILMFVVGILKYGERVWALRCAGSTPSGSTYRSFDKSTASAVGSLPSLRDRDPEAFLLMAHLLLAAPMDMLKGPSTFVDVHCGTSAIPVEDLYKVVEVQLSLMHDVFYTKAEVTHTWYGLCIRVISPLGTMAALLLFQLWRKDGYSRVDVAITYVLLVGAVVLEIMSALRALFSSWTFALLDQRAEGRNVWHFLACIVASLRRIVRAADWWRYWSGSMGQHNLLQLCAQSGSSKSSKIARWMGVEDPWNTIVYSSSVPIPAFMKQLLVKQVLKSEGASESSPTHIHNSRGRAALLERGGQYEGLVWSVDMGIGESIVVWHIATDMYLYWYKEQAKDHPEYLLAHAEVIEAVEVLSNYMFSLLATRTYMLPPPASRNVYVHVCYSLSYLEHSTPEDLAKLLRCNGTKLNTEPNIEGNDDTTLTGIGNAGDSTRYKKILDRASQLGAKLIDDKVQDPGATDVLEVITHVWVEMLCYVGYRCSAYSHAKQLSAGGELITIAALLMEQIRRQTFEF